MSGQDKPPLDKEARRLFLRASRELPPDMQARLDQARRQATAKAASGAGLQRRLWWPAGALAMACAMLVLWQPDSRTASTTHAAAPKIQAGQLPAGSESDSELPPDTGQGDAGMYQDLAFYNWLATAPASAH